MLETFVLHVWLMFFSMLTYTYWRLCVVALCACMADCVKTLIVVMMFCLVFLIILKGFNILPKDCCWKLADWLNIGTFTEMLIKGIVHFEIKIWYLSAYPKGIQDVGVFFSSVDPILMFLGQTVLVCQSYNGRYRSLSL